MGAYMDDDLVRHKSAMPWQIKSLSGSYGQIAQMHARKALMHPPFLYVLCRRFFFSIFAFLRFALYTPQFYARKQLRECFFLFANLRGG